MGDFQRELDQHLEAHLLGLVRMWEVAHGDPRDHFGGYYPRSDMWAKWLGLYGPEKIHNAILNACNDEGGEHQPDYDHCVERVDDVLFRM